MPACNRWLVHLRRVGTRKRRPPLRGHSRTQTRPGRGGSATCRLPAPPPPPIIPRATLPRASNQSPRATSSLAWFPAALGEELAKQASGRLGEHAGTDLDPVIVRRVA